MAEEPRELDAVVNEVVSEAHVRPEDLRPEERAFLQEHALKKPLRVLHIWAMPDPSHNAIDVSATAG